MGVRAAKDCVGRDLGVDLNLDAAIPGATGFGVSGGKRQTSTKTDSRDSFRCHPLEDQEVTHLIRTVF